MRALRTDLPVVIAAQAVNESLADLVAEDACTATIGKPYTGAGLKQAFEELKVRCQRG